MKIRIMAAATAPMVLAATFSFGSFKSTNSASPVPGDPIPGIDVSVEQSPGGVMKGTTNGDGIANISNVNPGHATVVHRCPKCAATGTQGGAFSVVVSSTGGGRSVSGEWKDASQPFKLELVVEGRGPQSVKVMVKLADAPRSRVKGESDQAAPISRVAAHSITAPEVICYTAIASHKRICVAVDIVFLANPQLGAGSIDDKKLAAVKISDINEKAENLTLDFGEEGRKLQSIDLQRGRLERQNPKETLQLTLGTYQIRSDGTTIIGYHRPSERLRHNHAAAPTEGDPIPGVDVSIEQSPRQNDQPKADLF